jgi:hypothetical protein
MRLKTRQRITAGLILAMVLLFLIPVLGDGISLGVHVAWQMTEIILLLILSAIWHDYNRDRKWKN